MKKVVVRVAVHDEKGKQLVMHAVSGISGIIESLALDLNDQKLTITGDIDPVEVVATLRKYWYTEIISFGPPEKKEEASKIEETKKDEVKNDDAKKDEGGQKYTDAEEIEDLIAASRNYYPYHPCIQPYYSPSAQPFYYYVPQRQPEYPNTCVIS